MPTKNTIIEVAIFTVKKQYINQVAEIRKDIKKVLLKFKGFISIEMLLPINSKRVFADIAKWQSLEDAQAAAKAFEAGDERFLPYIQCIEGVEFIGHFIQKKAST